MGKVEPMGGEEEGLGVRLLFEGVYHEVPESFLVD